MTDSTGIVQEVIDAYGGVAQVQKRFNYTRPMGVYNWRSRGIPKDKLIDIHIDTGISLERLRGEPCVSQSDLAA